MNFKSIIPIVTTIVFLSGCGGGSSSDTSTDDEVVSSGGSYTVVDPYIKDATFFWDKDKDGIQDTDEPTSNYSDEDGKFGFSETIPVGERIVMLEKGEHNGISYTGQLTANISSSKVISPLTTFEDLYPDLNISERLSELGIDISNGDIHKDPIPIKDDKLIISNISIDNFLKINNFINVSVGENTLSDIITISKSLIGYDTSDSNIQNSVSIMDYITNAAKIDGDLSELEKFKTDTTYLAAAKNALENRLDKSKPGRLYYSNGSFSSEAAKRNSKKLDEISLSFSSIPTMNSSTVVTLDIETIDSSSDISWTITEQPDLSTMTLSVSSDDKSITFTPTVKGDYVLNVELSSSTSTSRKVIPFTVKEVYSFNMDKVEGMSDDINSSTLIGSILNQSWVHSKTLNESELSTVISKYSSMTQVGFDETNGMLLEYDNTTSEALEDLEYLKLEQDVSNVFNRVFIGENAFQETAIYPDDNGDFNDQGANWHLETINMPEAWEYSKGSDDFLVGVCDGGFDNKSADMQGRFAKFLTTRASDHGMGVSGAISANTDNGIGMSGINWNSDVVASYMNDYGAVENTINTKINEKVVKLINNSWGYHLPSDFNPTNASMATQRFNDLQNWLAPFRHLVEVKQDKLFLWAAGNGVGNGASSTGYYGVDAKYDNGNLHYKNGVLNKLDNLLVVAAFHSSDKILRYYSEYGTSVDIAAPTEFDSLKLNNGTYASFGGTSAATPVTTAVASLIMSINPDLSPAQVKDILINSATEFVTRRQTNPYSPSTTEALAHQIPILNAKEALKMAYETVSTPTQTVIDYTAHISDNITPKISFRYFTDDKDYKVVAVSSTLGSSSSTTSYPTYGTKSVDSDSIEMSLDSIKRYHKIVSSLTLKHIVTGETKSESHTKEFTYSDLTIRTIDISTDNVVPYADFNLTYNTIFEEYSVSSKTDNIGLKKVYLPYSFYKVIGSKTGYKNSAIESYTSEAKSYEIDLPFGDDTGVESGYLSGVVLDEEGKALKNAVVSIYNGSSLIKMAITNSSGYYSLVDINKNDSFGVPITNFKMTATLTNYNTTMKQNVIVLDGKQRTENFTLISIPDNILPIANAGEDQSIVVGDVTIIGAEGSYDEDGYISKYTWTENGTQISTKHTFVSTNLTLGTHEYILTVTDNDGAINSDSVTIIVSGELTYDWDVSEWDECAGDCGTNNGIQSRTVVCKSTAGDVSSDSKCQATKPDVQQSCSTDACPFEYETITSSVTGKIWLDRNLGATEACSKSIDEFDSTQDYIDSQQDCFGDYYQWGRDADGHQSSKSGTTYIISLTSTPGHSNYILGSSSYDYDWTTADTELRSNSWLKSDGTGICPIGFKVPTNDELEAEGITSISEGFDILKLPLAGERDKSTGTVEDEGIFAKLWSSSVTSSKAITFKYLETSRMIAFTKHSYGNTIRCIEDVDAVIDNLPPVSNAGEDQTLTMGDPIFVNGSLSSDSDGVIVSYEWKNGTTLLSTESFDQIASLAVGTHPLTLTVTDDDGASDTDTVNITIDEPITYYWDTGSWNSCSGDCGPNNGIQTRDVLCKSPIDGSVVDNSSCTATKPATSQTCTASACGVGNIAPVAKAGSNQTKIFGEAIYVSGSQSSDSDGMIVSYEWKEGATVLSVSKTDILPTLSVGVHIITLTVTDDDGAIGTDTITVTVTSANPSSYYWEVGSWTLCAGDCGTDNGTKSRDIVCKSADSGATVSDSNCLESTKPDSTDSCTASICDVANIAPTAVAGEDQSLELGAPIFLNGILSSDSDGVIVSYEWKEDSTVLSNNKFDQLGTLSLGTHTITLTVTDDDGATGTDTVDITVSIPETISYYWQIGSWGTCTGDCGTNNSVQTRDVKCVTSNNGATAEDNLCTTTKPATSQSCTSSECIVDSEIIISPVTGRTWMDKNLGANNECTAFDDENCYGDYYQWGRDKDGHELVSSTTSEAISSTITPSNANFIVSDSANHYDWTSTDTDGSQRDTFWTKSDETSICPDGFRVPTIDELNDEDIQSLHDAYSKLKFSSAGVRQYNGDLVGKNIYGGTWSTSANGNYSSYLFYDEQTADWSYHSRAVGRTVRCIKEE